MVFYRILRGHAAKHFVFEQHKCPVLCLSFFHDGRSILSGSRDGVFHKWEISQCTSESALTTILELNDYRGGLSADGQTIIISFGTYFCRLSARSGKMLHECDVGDMASDDPYLSTLQPDGERIAFRHGDRGSLVSIYDTNSGALALGPLHSHLKPDDFVKTMIFSPRGSFLAVGTFEARLYLWNALTGEQLFTFDLVGVGKVRGLQFSPDERLLVSRHYSSIRVCHTRTGDIVRSIETTTEGIRSFDISPDSRYLAYGAESSVHFIDLWTGKEDPFPPFDEHDDDVGEVTFSPDGTLVASGSWDGTVRVWRVAMPVGMNSLSEMGGDPRLILGRERELLAWVPPELREGFKWTPEMRGEALGMSRTTSSAADELERAF